VRGALVVVIIVVIFFILAGSKRSNYRQGKKKKKYFFEIHILSPYFLDILYHHLTYFSILFKEKVCAADISHGA
jgi:hypothetical protein